MSTAYNFDCSSNSGSKLATPMRLLEHSIQTTRLKLHDLLEFLA